MRLPVAVAASLLLAGVLAGCGIGEPPEVVFTVAGTELTAHPARYCDEALTDCDVDDTAPVRVDVPAGAPLGIEVDDDIARTPWHVVFRYRTPAGENVDERSGVFAPGTRTEYTLTLPEAGDTLLTAEVQQFGPPPQAGQNGEVEFPIRASWVLVTPALDAAAPTG